MALKVSGRQFHLGQPHLRSPGLALAAQAHNDLALHDEHAPVAVAHHIEADAARRECRGANLPSWAKSWTSSTYGKKALFSRCSPGMFSCLLLHNRKLQWASRGAHLCQAQQAQYAGNSLMLTITQNCDP